jgi:hypothetical protein
MGSLVAHCCAAVAGVVVALVWALRLAERLAWIAMARQGPHRDAAWRGGFAGGFARLDMTPLDAKTPPE